jgi:hypothetical protein
MRGGSPERGGMRDVVVRVIRSLASRPAMR